MRLPLAVTLRTGDSAGVDIRSRTHEAVLCLPENDRTVVLAREFVQETLTEWLYPGPAHDVTLIVSELVTNALLHGTGTPELRLLGLPDRIRIEVADLSPLRPAMREPGPSGGWGLRLVERLGSGWGVTERDQGKVVWCEVPPGLGVAG